MHYYHLVCSIVILSYIQKIYLLLFYCYYQQYFICIIIYLISIIIPQTPCHRIISLYSNKLYIDISRSSVLSINVLLIFDTYKGNGALFLTFIVFFFYFYHYHLLRQLLYLSKQYMHHCSHINLILPSKF